MYNATPNSCTIEHCDIFSLLKQSQLNNSVHVDRRRPNDSSHHSESQSQNHLQYTYVLTSYEAFSFEGPLIVLRPFQTPLAFPWDVLLKEFKNVQISPLFH